MTSRGSRGHQASLGSPLLEETDTGGENSSERAAPRERERARAPRRSFSAKRICFQQVCLLRSSGRSRHLVGYWATVPLFLCSVKLTLFHSVKKSAARPDSQIDPKWGSHQQRRIEARQVCQWGCSSPIVYILTREDCREGPVNFELVRRQ